MPSSGVSITIILSEIIIIETILLVGWSVYIYINAKKRSSNLSSFLKSYLNDKAARTSTLSNIFKKPDFVTDDQYKTTLLNIIESENAFAKYLVDIIYKNDGESLTSFTDETHTILKPVSALLPTDSTKSIDSHNDTPVVDVDNAIDEFLSDDEEIEFDENNDPALDLSDPENNAPENTDEKVTENDEIAEIPSELLATPTHTAEPEPEPAPTRKQTK